MTDFIGMKERLWSAIWIASSEAIDAVLQEAWHDGYSHGHLDGYYYRKEVDREATKGKPKEDKGPGGKGNCQV